MIVERLYVSSCQYKIKHYRVISAQDHANELIVKDVKNGIKPRRWNAYRCPYCGLWHVGNRGKGGRGKVNG